MDQPYTTQIVTAKNPNLPHASSDSFIYTRSPSEYRLWSGVRPSISAHSFSLAPQCRPTPPCLPLNVGPLLLARPSMYAHSSSLATQCRSTLPRSPLNPGSAPPRSTLYVGPLLPARPSIQPPSASLVPQSGPPPPHSRPSM